MLLAYNNRACQHWNYPLKVSKYAYMLPSQNLIGWSILSPEYCQLIGLHINMPYLNGLITLILLNQKYLIHRNYCECLKTTIKLICNH